MASPNIPIPQPPPRPVVGNLPDIDSSKGILGLAEVAEQYGPIVRFQFFNDSLVALSSQELVNEVCDAARIVVETGGNPLAVEAARELAPEQLGGLEPLPDSLPVGRQLEDRFVRRVRGLPADTQRLLLLAADQPGRAARLTARPRYEAAGRAAWLDGRSPGNAREK
jgi:Cytochrome P450